MTYDGLLRMQQPLFYTFFKILIQSLFFTFVLL